LEIRPVGKAPWHWPVMPHGKVGGAACCSGWAHGSGAALSGRARLRIMVWWHADGVRRVVACEGLGKDAAKADGWGHAVTRVMCERERATDPL
jgi:hypothetical protein